MSDHANQHEPGALDWGRCPWCGATEDFGVHSEERLYATNHLAIAIDGDRLVTAEWGSTEPDYSSSVTRAYYADCCGEELLEGFQDALDEALANCRDPEA